MAAERARDQGRLGYASPQDIDRHVGGRLRERRRMLGLTQNQLAELIGVTNQQAHKYEKGINRISAGRLLELAQALGVGVGYFFEGVGSGAAPTPTPTQQALLELTRHFIGMPDRKHQEAICELARTMAQGSPALSNDTDDKLQRDTGDG